MKRFPWKIKRILLWSRYVTVPGKTLQTSKELSKANDGANLAAFKKLLYMNFCLLDTKNFGLKLEQNRNDIKPWEIVCFSDTYYAGRRHVNDFILYGLGVLVSQQSKAQKSITLSRSKAE